MAPYSEKSKQWRENNKDAILEWQKKIADLNIRDHRLWDDRTIEKCQILS
jgi:hypothetical protein